MLIYINQRENDPTDLTKKKCNFYLGKYKKINKWKLKKK